VYLSFLLPTGSHLFNIIFGPIPVAGFSKTSSMLFSRSDRVENQHKKSSCLANLKNSCTFQWFIFY